MRAVIRGGGSIGNRHAQVLAGLGAEVLLWPVRPRGADAPLPPGVTRHLRDDEGPAETARADLVVIATDTGRHVADALLALDAGGARVLVEKPLSPTAAAATPLLSHPRADRAAVAAPLRAHLGFAATRSAVHALPAPLVAHVACQSWLPSWRPGRDYRESYSSRADEGGVLRDLVHELDYATALLGRPRLQWSRLDRTGPLEMAAEQAATLVWETDRATVTCRLDYTSAPGRRVLTVDSPGGRVDWDVLGRTVTRVAPQGARQVERYDEDADRDSVMRRQVEAFLAGRSAEQDPAAPPTLAEALAVVDLCDQARTRAAAHPSHPRPANGAPVELT